MFAVDVVVVRGERGGEPMAGGGDAAPVVRGEARFEELVDLAPNRGDPTGMFSSDFFGVEGACVSSVFTLTGDGTERFPGHS